VEDRRAAVTPIYHHGPPIAYHTVIYHSSRAKLSESKNEERNKMPWHPGRNKHNVNNPSAT
jgi:hypothetical protein